jgi:hypothetical protein
LIDWPTWLDVIIGDGKSTKVLQNRRNDFIFSQNGFTGGYWLYNGNSFDPQGKWRTPTIVTTPRFVTVPT